MCAEQFFVLFSLLTDFLTAYLINCIHEVANNMRFVEHQHGVRSPLFNDINGTIRMPGQRSMRPSKD